MILYLVSARAKKKCQENVLSFSNIFFFLCRIVFIGIFNDLLFISQNLQLGKKIEIKTRRNKNPLPITWRNFVMFYKTLYNDSREYMIQCYFQTSKSWTFTLLVWRSQWVIIAAKINALPKLYFMLMLSQHLL